MLEKIYLIFMGVLPMKIINRAKKKYLSFTLKKYVYIDKTVTFGSNCIIYGAKNNVLIGENTYVNEAQIFAGDKSIVKIGENCSIGYRVSIKSKTHGLSKVYHDKKGNHDVIEKDIIIGDRCWIGDGVFIREGVTLGEDVIVGANSVVTKSFPKKVIIGGVPAKVLKIRDLN